MGRSLQKKGNPMTPKPSIRSLFLSCAVFIGSMYLIAWADPRHEWWATPTSLTGFFMFAGALVAIFVILYLFFTGGDDE